MRLLSRAVARRVVQVQFVIGRNLDAAEVGASIGTVISDQPLPVEQFVQLFEVRIESSVSRWSSGWNCLDCRLRLINLVFFMLFSWKSGLSRGKSAITVPRGLFPFCAN